jgi:hypothetical protein
MTATSETAMDDQMVPADHQTVLADDQPVLVGDRDVPQGLSWDPDGIPMPDDLQPPAPDSSEHLGTAAVGSSAVQEPVIDTEPERPSAVSAPGAEPASASASPVAGDNAGPSTRWLEIQAVFVDDPRSSVELAAGLVDDSVETLVASARERQHSLLSAWQDESAGTEELRIALQQYRAFWNRLEDLSREA